MEINFGDTIPLSTLDWPGKAVITVFFRGCCFECPFCQNYELIEGEDMKPITELFNELDETNEFVDGIIASGGEPMMQPDAIKELAKYSREKELGFGLHTNGYFPKELKRLLEGSYLDFVSLDIKAPLDNKEKYSEVTGTDIDLNKINRSLDHLKQNNVELEVRTTVFRNKIDIEEIRGIIDFLKDEKYVIQQGRTEDAYKEEYRELEPFKREELIDLAQKIDYPNLYVRTKEEGDVEI